MTGSTMADFMQKSIGQVDGVQAAEKEMRQWVQRLLENMKDDPSNQQTHLSNAMVEVNEFIAPGLAVTAVLENLVQPMKNKRQLKKAAMAQTILPSLIMAKFLQLLEEKRGK